MISRAPMQPERIRKITGSFSWLDHGLLHDGHLEAMTVGEMVLYFFLVLVSDRNGVSFYSYDKICMLLKLTSDEYISARNCLISKDLIAFDGHRYQVLQLPKKAAPHSYRATQPDNETKSLAEIFSEMVQKTRQA